MKRVTAVIAALWLFAVPRLAAADHAKPETVLRQAAGQLAPGDRIRVTSPPPLESRFSGWFEGVESDSILRVRLSRRDAALPVYPRQVGSIEVSAGSHRHVLGGAVTGLLLGAVVGLAIGRSEPDPSVDLPYVGPVTMQGLNQSEGLVVGAGVGLVTGAVIGYLVRGERWEAIAP